MLEKRHQKLLSRKAFHARVIRNVLVAVMLISGAAGIGTAGYHYLGKLGWVDAFLNACMILSGMGPVDPLPNDAAKLFASFYALFSGITFLTSVGVLFVPVVHRLIHRIHIESEDDERKDDRKR
jgi:hypothetical protein